MYSNCVNNNIIHKKIKNENEIIKSEIKKDADLDEKPAKNIKLETEMKAINTSQVVKSESSDYESCKSEPISHENETIMKKCDATDKIIILVKYL